MFNKSRFFRLSDRGQSLSEYAVIIGLAAIVVVAGIYFYRTKLSSAYKGAAKDVAAVDASPATTRSGSLPSSSQIENIQNQARQLWASPRFKLMLLGLVFLIMCLMFLNQYRAQKRLGRTQSLSGENGDNGQAMTEFVLAFPVMLLTILIIFQMSLLFIGHFMLNYAAFCAARTAAVWIPADLTKSEQGNGQGGGQSNNNKEKENELVIKVEGKDTLKIDKIRNAARLACTPISPPLTRLLYESAQEVSNAINNSGNFLDSSLNSFSDLIENAVQSMTVGALEDFAKQTFKDMFNPMVLLGLSDPSGGSPGSSGGMGSLDFSSFLGTLGDSLKQNSSLGDSSWAGLFPSVDSLLGESATVMGGVEAPPPGFPELPLVVKFLDKYAVSCILTSVQVRDTSGTVQLSSKMYTANEDVIVEVNHLFHLGIPIANGIIGKRKLPLPGKYYNLTSQCIIPTESRIKCANPPQWYNWF